MKTKLSGTRSFKRPGDLIGGVINQKVAERLAEYLMRPKKGEGMSEAEAYEMIDSMFTSHAFDELEGQLEITESERDALNDIAGRMALAVAKTVRSTGASFLVRMRESRQPIARR